MRPLLLAAALLAAPAGAQACPGLVGSEAANCVDARYSPTSVLSDAASKDRLYDTVDRATVAGQDGVVGLYSGAFVPFDGVPNSDPSQDVFNNGQGINQEHIFPRSRGTDNHLAERDMHHLFPTRVDVNADRGSDPFRTISDTAPSRWYQGDATQSATPSDPDAWSQDTSSGFEPRASVRGDVARAMFYIAATYPDRVDAPWFESQAPTLLQWHAADPPTDAEVARSERVAGFQSGCAAGPCVNPFVTDATLAGRVFATSTTGEDRPLALAVGAPFPVPTGSAVSVPVRVRAGAEVRATVIDALGRRMGTTGRVGPGLLHIELGALAAGVYGVRVEADGAVVSRRVVRR
ncbi:endonuclease [Rubrivirga sp. IMCC43871]|uniref:endonuclease n=1 Tax=Rubrivirga sp. IMCC43871 TaxID=3391575 RepID=UPI00398FBF4C